MVASPAPSEPGASLWQTLGWQPEPQQREQFVALQAALRQANQRVNLTRLVEGDDFWIAQVFDSLWPLLPQLQAHRAGSQEPLQIIDVGTGGGFPGLAVAIALPSAQLTLVDSVSRKVDAVAAMVADLGLQQRVTLRCDRIERCGQASDCRSRFDWALARAVASAPVVAEYLVPLLRPQGRALLYRGQWSAGDQVDLERALVPLRAAIEQTMPLELPAERGIRHALVLRSLGPCPKTYPRAVGVPAKHPLGGSPG
jgi:16S rRNA (guanine527-N7)-methyltransferase